MRSGIEIELDYRSDMCRVLKGAHTEHPKGVLFHFVRVVRFCRKQNQNLKVMRWSGKL
jgi:hypothetical protein